MSTTAPAGGNDRSCAHAGYGTVQSAVNAAQTFESGTPSDPTIDLCGGTFTEQVTVTNASLKFVNNTATSPSTIELPASVGNDQSTGLSTTTCQNNDQDAGVSAPQSVLEICQTGSSATTVSITGITIEGDWPSTVCYDSLYGILVGGGAKLDLTDSTVENIGGPATDGCQGGVAVQIGLSPTAQVGHGDLSDDIITSYQKNGITVDGAGSSATIAGGSVTGGGSGSQTAQNGIQVSSGATAAISGEAISANECGITPPTCGPDPWSNTQATGILLYDEGTPTSVKTSTITDNDTGIYNIQQAVGTTSGVTISGNTITGSDEAIGEDSGWSTVTDNDLSDNSIGIWIPQYAGQPVSPEISASGNVITGNAQAGVQVESDNSSSDLPVLATVSHNDLSQNPVGVQNNSTSIVTAKNDWWGGTEGPSGTGIGVSTSSVSSSDPNVNFFPWSKASSDTATTATTSSPAACTKSGTNVSSSVANAVLCLTGSGDASYSGVGPVLVLGNGSDVVTLGAAANGVSLILDGGSSTVNANGAGGVYQYWYGATATFSGGSNLTPASSALVTQ